MHIVQHVINVDTLHDPLSLPDDTALLLIFGDRGLMQQQDFFARLRQACPHAQLVGCSTAGEIHGTAVLDGTVVLTAIRFDATQIRIAVQKITQLTDSRRAGAALSQELLRDDLRHLLVLSDGLNVNGSDLVQGLREPLPLHVNVTGGLAADGAEFRETVVIANAPAESGQVVCVGFYSDCLKVGYGSLGGWDAFGPERRITRSHGNVLYELDNDSALNLYKTYLGPHADNLPASALLFPLALRLADSDATVVRTVLAVDDSQNSMTFAGDMPQGCYVQLMKANFNRLVDGAIGAAEINRAQLNDRPAELAILISCVGRKLVLKQRIEEETEGVADILGKQAVLAGFYSYGEIAPHGALTRCELHNQTMTVTTFSEEK